MWGGGGYAVQHVKGGVVGNGTGWTKTEEVGGGVEAFYPKFRRHVSLEKKCAHDVVGGANGPLSFAILWRGMGEGEA